MSLKIGVVMDPIAKIKPKKETTFAIMLAAQHKQHILYYIESINLFIEEGIVKAKAYLIKLIDDPHHWYQLLEEQTITLNSLDVVLMRLDPPVNTHFLNITQILSLAQTQGAKVVNHPASLRDANEKLFIHHFKYYPETLVTADDIRLKDFLKKHQDIILKPLDGMAGQSIFRVSLNDPNFSVIFETLTMRKTRLIMAQRYLPEIKQGDKRILLINGKIPKYALARIPAIHETRANLAVGGQPKAQLLTSRDKEICQALIPSLKERGLFLVGLDVIGDYLTEINVTSPTGFRELAALTEIDLAEIFLQELIEYL